jgi:hypothetical protein
MRERKERCKEGTSETKVREKGKEREEWKAREVRKEWKER